MNEIYNFFFTVGDKIEGESVIFFVFIHLLLYYSGEQALEERENLNLMK